LRAETIRVLPGLVEDRIAFLLSLFLGALSNRIRLFFCLSSNLLGCISCFAEDRTL
jgi:hypothetical protein